MTLQLSQAKARRHKKRLKRLLGVLALSIALCVVLAIIGGVTAHAAGVTIDVQADEAGEMGALEVIAIFAFLALLPSILLMMTCFTRIIIVLSFLRSAMGTQQSPPNLVLIGLSIFLSLFIMMPVVDQMNEVAYEPYSEGELEAKDALTAAAAPVKEFMLKQTDKNTLDMYLKLSDTEAPEVADAENPTELTQLPLLVVTPAFVTSELARAFLMGFLIFLPFLIIDLVVASILMSMGMMMLPPAMISLPFKLLLFVLVDGWDLMMGTLVSSFS